MRTVIIIAALMISKPLRVLADMNQIDKDLIILILSITLIIDIVVFFSDVNVNGKKKENKN